MFTEEIKGKIIDKFSVKNSYFQLCNTGQKRNFGILVTKMPETGQRKLLKDDNFDRKKSAEKNLLKKTKGK